MLEDVITNTHRVFQQFIPDNKPINSKIALYDTYRAMKKMLDVYVWIS